MRQIISVQKIRIQRIESGAAEHAAPLPSKLSVCKEKAAHGSFRVTAAAQKSKIDSVHCDDIAVVQKYVRSKKFRIFISEFLRPCKVSPAVCIIQITGSEIRFRMIQFNQGTRCTEVVVMTVRMNNVLNIPWIETERTDIFKQQIQSLRIARIN